MSCDDCAQAAKQPWHGYRMGCKGCAARAVICSTYWRTAFAPNGFGWNDRKLLQLCVYYDVSREQVEAAAKVDAVHKETAK